MKLLNKPRAILRDALQSLKQSVRAANRHRLYRRRMKKGVDYAHWIARNDTPSEQDRASWAEWLVTNPDSPLISVILNVDAGMEVASIKRGIDSLLAQIYPHWELVATTPGHGPQHALIQQLASANPRIQILTAKDSASEEQRWRAALLRCSGTWVALWRAGDQWREHSLLLMAQAAKTHPGARLIYPDEDQITQHGRRTSHHFKPDWNRDFQISANYIGHVCWILRSHLRDHLGQASSAPTSDAYGIVLRCTQGLPPDQIVHVPHVLWHRPKSVVQKLDGMAVRALQAHLDQAAPGATSSLSPQGFLRVQYAIPPVPPLVSIVICTRNQYKLLHTCIQSITEKTDYPCYEIIVVDNGSDEARALDYLQQLPRQDDRVRVIRDDRPFNYSALNNMAVAHAKGDMVALLNNDIEVINADWLTEMVGHALRPEIGCVGAKLLYPDETVQHVGVLVGSGSDAPGAIAAHYLRGIPREAPGYANRAIVAHQLTAVTAACLVIRKSIFNQVGGLDSEHLGVTYNDVDFCLRVRELGLHNILTPHALLYHHESVSRGRDAAAKNKARFLPELAYMKQRWATRLKRDPCYNPNLSHQKPDFLLADSIKTP